MSDNARTDIQKPAASAANSAREMRMEVGINVAISPDDRFHPDIQGFFLFWQSKCGARALPARSDFDPSEMVPFLSGITLIDVVEDERRFVYRLLGTREVAMRGRDPTGKGVADGFHATSAEAAIGSYQDVVDRRAARFEQRRFMTPGGRIGHEQTIILPLSDDGDRINKLIAYTHHFLA
ncbi:PAS domain-containing protein [Dongia sp.]|uniref:PAS domain-containing protein n=1 Tax=Dongia sp. TaxID=1977262 RepID=UPI0035B2D718